MAVRLSMLCVAMVSIRTEEDNVQKSSGFSEPNKREDWEEPLQFLKAPSLAIRRTLEGLVGRLKISEVLNFVTISFPMFWLFAIIAELRRFWSHIGSIICKS